MVTGSESMTSATLIPSIRLANSVCAIAPRADWPRTQPISASQMPLKALPWANRKSPNPMKP